MSVQQPYIIDETADSPAGRGQKKTNKKNWTKNARAAKCPSAASSALVVNFKRERGKRVKMIYYYILSTVIQHSVLFEMLHLPVLLFVRDVNQ